jgi:septal ring factor EnvC (AmiA/AmiB activator)
LDWKPFRRSPLSGIIALIFLSFAFAAENAGRDERTPSMYEKEIRKKSDALDSIRTEIDFRRRKIRELEKAEGSSLDRLEYLEANIAASRRYLLLLTRKIDSAGATIALLKDSLALAGIQLADRKKLMRQRLRQAYMAPRESPLMIFFMARSPAEAIQQTRYLEAVHAYDCALAEKIDREQQSFNMQKGMVESSRAELDGLLAEKTGENNQLLQEEAERRTIVQEIRSKEKTYMARIVELESARKKLDEMIKVLELKNKFTAPKRRLLPALPTAAFEKLKGDLPWPIDGPIVGRFGKIVHPVYKTVTTNKGIDIEAAPGRSVKCVASGDVLYIGTMRGLGKLVIVDHGSEYLTIYANLDQIAVSTGQRLNAGSTVGIAGAGDEENGSQVHFEIRKSTDSLDPLNWLSRR